MRKMITVVALAAIGFSAPGFAQSGTGSVSGSAGLGIDLAGITSSVNANPTITTGSLGPVVALKVWGSRNSQRD